MAAIIKVAIFVKYVFGFKPFMFGTVLPVN